MTTVRIQTPDTLGSGVFVTSDVVVTAAHVIHPDGETGAFEPAQLAVVLRDGTVLDVVACLCTQRWTDSFAGTADMAVVRVATPQPAEVIGYVAECVANDRAVTISGYREAANTGAVTRVGDAAGHDIFESDDLAFHEGVSGAPVVASDGRALGIATRSATTPTPNSFVGIPFLANAKETNLAWLLQQCPQGDE